MEEDAICQFLYDRQQWLLTGPAASTSRWPPMRPCCGVSFCPTSTATTESDVPLAELQKFSITQRLEFPELLLSISAGYSRAGATIAKSKAWRMSWSR